MKKCRVVDFHFYNIPKTEERQPLKGMSRKELNSIKKFPFIVKEDVEYEITLLIKEDYEYVCKGKIRENFPYNMADIPDPLQCISYDKHSPFVRSASLIHDYLLVNKFRLYNEWNLAELGITFSDFRDVTSEVFRIELENSAVSHRKATLMSMAVNLWQHIIFPFKLKLHDEQKDK